MKYLLNRSNNFDRLVFIILPFLILFIYHLLFNLNIEQPIVWADELIYLGHARYFITGHHILLTGQAFAHFGYSLLITPAYLLFTNPDHIYSAVMVINALLLSSLYLILFYIVYRFLKIDIKIAALISFLASFYPAFILTGTIAWAESAFIPLYALIILSLILFLKKDSYWTAILFGLLSGFIYMVHIRGLAIIIASTLFLIFLVLIKKVNYRKALASFLVMTLLVIVTILVNNKLLAIAFVDPASYSNIFSKLFSLDSLRRMFLAASGQLLYLIQATYGLFLFALFFLFRYLKKIIKLKIFTKDNKAIVFTYLLLSSFIIFGASLLIVFGTDNHPRSHYLIYGRYNEGFLALYLVLALVWFYKRYYSSEKRKFLYTVLAIGFLTGLTLLLDKEQFLFIKATEVQVFGIDALISFFGWPNIAFISGVVILLLLILYKLFSIRFVAGLLLLLIIFNIFTMVSYQKVLSDSRVRTYDIDRTILNYIDNSDIKELSYDNTIPQYFFPWFYNYFYYQFYFEDIKIKPFFSKEGGLPDYSYVISHTKWPQAQELGAQPLIIDIYKKQVLWKLPN